MAAIGSEVLVSRRPKRRLAVLALTVVALVLGACGDDGDDGDELADLGEAAAVGSDDESPFQGVPLAEGTPKPEFTLTDTNGNDFDFVADTDGSTTLLFFGYTHCPDICPPHLAQIAQVLDRPGTPTNVEVVFVTVDPERDPPERLKEYLEGFDERFVGLHGDLEEINEAHRDLMLPEPIHEEPDEDGNYYVSHAAAIIAFHPDDDRAHAMYPFGIRRQHWVQELPRLVAGEELG